MFYWVLKVVLYPFLRAFWRPWVEGLENVPAAGPAILASNHLSFLDSIFLPLVVPRRVTFLAKIDYFTEAGFKGWAKRMFFSSAGQLPIDRSGGKASEGALRSGVRLLRQGKLLGIYPEGTRSPDGRLYRGKIGVARMALEAKVKVIPVAMIGTFEIQPQGRTLPRIGRVGIRIGRPLDFSRYEDMADDRFVLRSVTDEIMYELMQLSGQEYVDRYAQQAKEELAAARAAAAAVVAPAGEPPKGGHARKAGKARGGAARTGAGPAGAAATAPAPTPEPAAPPAAEPEPTTTAPEPTAAGTARPAGEPADAAAASGPAGAAGEQAGTAEGDAAGDSRLGRVRRWRDAAAAKMIERAAKARAGRAAKAGGEAAAPGTASTPGTPGTASTASTVSTAGTTSTAGTASATTAPSGGTGATRASGATDAAAGGGAGESPGAAVPPGAPVPAANPPADTAPAPDTVR